MRRTIAAILLGWTFTGAGVSADPAARKQAESIFATTGFRGGLVVHLGCGSGRLTAALREGGADLVHGLDSSSAEIDEARTYIRSLGLYGPVSVACWGGDSLPYVDYLVNLLVVEDLGQVSKAEMLRVLVPGGVAYLKNGDTWTKTVKPAREEVDEWTHYLHDASGNPVAHDTVVGPPTHLQWVAPPAHTRSHEYTSSIAAVVSSGGRIFYIADEGPPGNLQGAADWQVVARDAHNGLLLWKRAIAEWFSHLSGWTSGPIQLQRRMVAIGDRVYVTLGYHDPVSALDAATGKILMTYAGTEGADEIICHEGVLIVGAKALTDERLAEHRKWAELAKRRGSPLHLRDTRRPLVKEFRKVENAAGRSVIALDPGSGRELWKLTGANAAGLRPLSLRACGDRVYCHKNGGLFSIDLRSGKTLWSKKCDGVRAVREDALVCWSKKKVTLLSPEDGSVRWTQPAMFASARDVFITRDSVWIGGLKPYDTGRKHTGPAWGPFFAAQRELATGKVVREITPENPGHHQRCYSGKATDRYMIGGRRGTEFIDLESGEHYWNSWARGVCRYGVMPANGFLYTPPHSCGCYITAKLTGFNALVSTKAARRGSPRSGTDPLQKGPAYGKAVGGGNAGDWPTYRGNSGRSGCAATTLPTALVPKWQIKATSHVTPVTVADGKVLVACPDEHELLALDVDSGKRVWTFTTDGRIDSPPTVHDGRALLGCRDGSVYSVQASDGALAWRLRVARSTQQVGSYGQLESASPVHGSVLVSDNVAYVTAGRSSYLDGGIDLCRLEPATGKVLSRTSIYSPDPETGRQPEQYSANAMPGARSDILVADDRHVYLRDLAFGKDGVEQTDRVPHLFTLTDFLDSSWTHRSYWIFGTKASISTGCSGRDRKLIYGRLLLLSDATVYGYGRKKVHWSSEFEDAAYRLYARKRTATEATWSTNVPVQVRAMLKAGDVILVAGPAVETVGTTEPVSGRRGAQLLAYSAADGSELARYPLSAPPVFDGMAAAGGKLFLSLEGGGVVCMAGK